jgi:plastocyanin
MLAGKPKEGARMKRISLLLAVAVAAAAIVVATGAAAAPLTGTVGPGFTITMTKKTTRAGLYTFRISDRSSSHNFHLKGPGVNRAITTVAGTGLRTFTVRLRRGVYTFYCEPHAFSMRGTLRVT